MVRGVVEGGESNRSVRIVVGEVLVEVEWCLSKLGFGV